MGSTRPGPGPSSWSLAVLPRLVSLVRAGSKQGRRNPHHANRAGETGFREAAGMGKPDEGEPGKGVTPRGRLAGTRMESR